MRYGPAAALQKTVRSTSRARDHRNSPRMRQGHHLDQTSAHRRKRKWASGGISKFLHDGCLGGVCEHGVGPFPPATISRDRAINRISLEARKRPAALAELRNLSGRKGDIGARRNIAAVRDRGSVDRLLGPIRIRPTSGRAVRVSRTASCMLAKISAGAPAALRTTTVRRPIAPRSAHASPSGPGPEGGSWARR
jgi:hypothetical protein